MVSDHEISVVFFFFFLNISELTFCEQQEENVF